MHTPRRPSHTVPEVGVSRVCVGPGGADAQGWVEDMIQWREQSQGRKPGQTEKLRFDVAIGKT